jgi:alpha-glucoside transport system permease protein
VIGRRWWVAWLWIAPALMLTSLFLLYPTLDSVRRSLLDPEAQTFVGLENYRFLVENPNSFVLDTHSAFLNNALWVVVFTATTVGLGLILAVLTSRVKYESAVQSAIFVPMAISFVAAAVIWRFMYDINPLIGTLNAILTAIHREPVAWLQDIRAPQQWLTQWGPEVLPKPLHLNNFALILVAVWMWTGFAMVVLAAGLKGVPTEILEAARVDGASELQVFWRIIIPILAPTILVVATTLVILSLKLFDLIWVMTGGRFDTDVVATLYLRTTFILRNFGVGSALAVVLFLCVLPVSLLSVRRIRTLQEGR